MSFFLLLYNGIISANSFYQERFLFEMTDLRYIQVVIEGIDVIF